MARDWIEWFDLEGDPFSESPLRMEEDFDRLLVKTQDISEAIDPIARYICSSVPSVKVLMGDRGAGKSTILLYLDYLLGKETTLKVLPVYIFYQKTETASYDDPQYGIGASTIWHIVRSLIFGLKNKFKDVYEKHSKALEGWATHLGISEEIIVSKRPLYRITFDILTKILEIFQKENIWMFIGIDNYDKIEAIEALEFLRGNHAQPLIEKLLESGATVMFAAYKGWKEKLQHSDYSYLGTPILISELNPDEAKDLIERRINRMSKSLSERDFPFQSDAILSLTVSTGGIAREILKNARLCMIQAYRNKEKRISRKTVDDVLGDTLESYARYYETIEKNENAMRAFERLTSFCEEAETTEELERSMNTLLKVYEDKEVDLNKIKTLLGARLVIKTNGRFTLREDILPLFKVLEKRRLSRKKFIKWLCVKGLAETRLIPSAQERDLNERFEYVEGCIDQELPKEQISQASLFFKNFMNLRTEEDSDPNTVIENAWQTLLATCKAAYYLNELLIRRKIDITIPDSETLREFLATEISIDSEYSFVELKNQKDFAQRMKFPKDQINKISEILFQFLSNLLAKIEEILAVPTKLVEEIQKIPITTDTDLANRLRSAIYGKSKVLTITDVGKSIRDLAVAAWKHEKSNIIYGFITPNFSQKYSYLTDIYQINLKFVPPQVNSIITKNFRHVGSPEQRIDFKFYDLKEFTRNFLLKYLDKSELYLRSFRPERKEQVEWELRALDGKKILLVYPKGKAVIEEILEPKGMIAIKNGERLKAANTIERLFKELIGTVRLQLPYIDETTLEYLEEIPRECDIRLLVGILKNEKKFTKKARFLSKGRRSFEVRQILFENGTAPFHDRIVISKNFFIQIGADLKRDSLGNKDHNISWQSPDDIEVRKCKRRHNAYWKDPQTILDRDLGKKVCRKVIFSKKS